jgi:hypothetical protein
MKDEALKLALEALESCGEGHITDGGTQWHDAKLIDKAITAIKQALAAPVQPGRNHYEDGDVFERIAAMNKPPAQPAPVPLTDEQIDVLRESKSKGRGAGWSFDFKGFARSIEVHHGITEKGQP